MIREPWDYISTNIQSITEKFREAKVLLPPNPTKQTLEVLASGGLRFVRAPDVPLLDAHFESKKSMIKWVYSVLIVYRELDVW